MKKEEKFIYANQICEIYVYYKEKYRGYKYININEKRTFFNLIKVKSAFEGFVGAYLNPIEINEELPKNVYLDKNEMCLYFLPNVEMVLSNGHRKTKFFNNEDELKSFLENTIFNDNVLINL